MDSKYLKLSAFLLGALAVQPAAAAAQDQGTGERQVVIGAGVQSKPRYPGADTNKISFLPLVDTWRDGEPMIAKAPDEPIGIALVGNRTGRFAAGPVLAFAPTRSADARPGLPKVGFGVEAGGFVEFWPVKPLRLRGELRQGIGAHKALTGDVAADFVWRNGNDGAILTVGPRVRWGDARYIQTYFGVAQPGTSGFAQYLPEKSGVYAVGAVAGLRLPLNRTLGLYGYVGYDRLTGQAARSPIVRAGRADQFSSGIALTFHFGL